ncbi:MAG: phosphate-selective porin OprO/OprP [Pirellulaceae bacterium]|jgi:phosphate-selective porin OprO/OprP
MRRSIVVFLLFSGTVVAGEPQPLVDPNSRYDVDVLQRLETLELELLNLRGATQVSGSQIVPASHSISVPCQNCGQFRQNCPCEQPASENAIPKWKVTGFFQLDAGYYDQDAVNIATLGTDIQDAAGFRRARLAAKGNVTERTSYILEFDFAQAQGRFVDVWMQFAETPLGNLRIGRYRQPFGLSELTSVRDLPFLERPLQFSLAPFRQTGIMLFDTALDEHVTWSASGYRYLSDNFGNTYGDGGYGMAARLTMLPIDHGDDRLFHVGLDYSYNDPGRDQVQFANSNEFFAGQNPNLGPSGLSVLPIVAVPPFVNTGAIPTSRTNLYNVEAAISFGRLLFQSEARWASVEHLDGTTNTFPGAYAHVRYVLTGETIPYNRKTGSFGRIKPCVPVDIACGQWGAWEIAGRISHLDLNGTNLPGPGRRLTDTTIGLNWYVNDYTKFQFNWIHADLDDPTLGSSTANTFAARGQIDF